MYKVQDILIPSRFLIFILQVLLTITAGISHKDNILAGIDSNLTENSQEYSDGNKEFLVALILFYVFEAIEMGIMLSGLTLFNNKLSIVQIFFHSVCVLLLCWFNHEQWEYWSMNGLLGVLFLFSSRSLDLCQSLWYTEKLLKLLK